MHQTKLLKMRILYRMKELGLVFLLALRSNNPLTFIWWVQILGDCYFLKHFIGSNNIPRAPAGRLEMKIQYRIQSQFYGPCENANCTVKERHDWSHSLNCQQELSHEKVSEKETSFGYFCWEMLIINMGISQERKRLLNIVSQKYLMTFVLSLYCTKWRRPLVVRSGSSFSLRM